MSVRVECPSGLIVNLRRFKLADKDLMASKRTHRLGATTVLLRELTESIEEPGPYGLSEDGNLDWDDVLQGDRTAALLTNRIETWGDEMIAKRKCQSPSCNERIVMEYSLQDLEIRKLPKTSLPHVSDPDRTPLKTTLPSGAVVSFRLIRGGDEKKLKKLKKNNRDNLATAFMHYRVVEVAGVEKSKLRAWLANMDGRDDVFLEHAMDEAGCGVDTEVVFECPDCDYEWEEDVELGEDFLFPAYRGRSSTKK